MSKQIYIFDTTMRDGEQSPHARMNVEEKLAVTKSLLRLNVDCIEAGFPASSPGDFEAVQKIAKLVGENATVAALSRAVFSDIEQAAYALDGAAKPRIHTGLGTSAIHLQEKLHLTEDEAIEKAVAAVRYAKSFVPDVQFYAEDAGRSDYDFLARIIAAVIEAGANVVNIPETTGFSLPEEFGRRIAYLYEHVPSLSQVTLAVHCHNDLGLATALSLAGVQNGATQIECTVNGLGERAGNTPLEEVAMAIALHAKELDAYTAINTKELTRASRLVSQITGVGISASKPIVGAHAFAHSSGIHQDGVLKAPQTYEIMSPEDVGAAQTALVLTARSGHAALKHALEELGYAFDNETFEKIHASFIALADKKKELYDEDLEALVHEYARENKRVFQLNMVQVSCGYPLTATATLELIDAQGVHKKAAGMGDGPIDAVFKAVDSIVGVECELLEYNVAAITRGIDALGEVRVRLASDTGEIFTGRGADSDIVVSSTKAYLNALNRLLIAKEYDAKKETHSPKDKN